jgi:hypothetical protein
MKKLFFLFLMFALLISPTKISFATSTVNAQMNSLMFYQKPTQSWSEYFEERKNAIIGSVLIGATVIGVGVCLYMWGPSLSIFLKGLFLGAIKNIDTIERNIEGNIVRRISTERYNGHTITPLHQTRNHFYYQDSQESYVAGDCGLFAVRRIINHARILGHTSLPDLSDTSNQDLRNTMVNYMSSRLPGNFDYLRQPLEYITQYALSFLMRGLGVPEGFIRFTGIGADDENAYEKAPVFRHS